VDKLYDEMNPLEEDFSRYFLNNVLTEENLADI
jgi:hypothetical protein